MKNHVLLVDDDQNIILTLSMLLENEGYKITSFSDGAKALHFLDHNDCDIGIFDIKMPRMDGLQLLKNIRKNKDMPVIFLTSKDTELDETEGFLHGADDYITKPFSTKLLLGRIKAVLRRSYPDAFENGLETHKHYKRGHLVLDPQRHLCHWKDQKITITVTEFLIVEALVRRVGHTKSREILMDTIYQDDIYVDDRTIDSHIKRLRKKFRTVDPEFNHIKTLYGIGYKWEES